MDKNYYIMLAATPERGSQSVTVICEPDAFTNRGREIKAIKEKYDFLLEVDSHSKIPLQHTPLDLQQTGKTLLFSPRLINLLMDLGIENIQYFDANVLYAPTKLSIDYKVANIIGVVEGVDIELSEVVIDEDIIIDIEQLVFDENKMEGHKIFRLEESILHIVVHRSVKEAMEKAGITGVTFLTDNEFEPGMI